MIHLKALHLFHRSPSLSFELEGMVKAVKNTEKHTKKDILKIFFGLRHIGTNIVLKPCHIQATLTVT